ncbi:hypothetical protein INR49_009765 [Caranx melampygus]|nr:hypothetical protein INR49_009765 [Caranx melampygus]
MAAGWVHRDEWSVGEGMIDTGGLAVLIQRGAVSMRRREMMEAAYDKRTDVYVEGCVRVSSSWGLRRGSEPW